MAGSYIRKQCGYYDGTRDTEAKWGRWRVDRQGSGVGKKVRTISYLLCHFSLAFSHPSIEMVGNILHADLIFSFNDSYGGGRTARRPSSAFGTFPPGEGMRNDHCHLSPNCAACRSFSLSLLYQTVFLLTNQNLQFCHRNYLAGKSIFAVLQSEIILIDPSEQIPLFSKW